jgi:long-chain acyl-CoA synthetase
MDFATIIHAIAHFAEKTPEKVCLIETESKRTLTYAELWTYSLSFARRLKQAGLTAGSRVVARVGGVLETHIAQFGTYLAGGVFCPAERNAKASRLTEMLRYFETDFLASSITAEGAAHWFDLGTFCENDSEAAAGGLVLPKPEDLCAIIFTTGTSGKAKGVMLNHTSIAVFAKTRAAAFEASPDDVFLWVQPLQLIGGVRAPSHVFFTGGTVVYYNGIVFINDFFKTIGEYRVTDIYLQSYALTILLRNNSKGFSQYNGQIRKIMVGGGFLPDNNKAELSELLPDAKLIIHYNATEIAPISYYVHKPGSAKSGCVGKPFACTAVRILDESGNEINSSKTRWGTVECEGDTAMLGYWNDPELTAKTLNGKKVKMADAGYFDEDGFLYLMGRRDDVIVSGGFKIAPYEIENAAVNIPGVSEAICVGSPDAILSNVPKLFVTIKEGSEFSVKQITAALAEKLETYKLPRTIRQLDEFPRVAGSQKIDRKALLNYD